MRALWTLACKDLSLVLHDKGGFFFIFIFPILYAVLFSMIFQGAYGGGGKKQEKAITVLYVDEDDTEQSRAFLTDLGEQAAINLKPAESKEAAFAAVRKGRFPLCLVFAEGFGAASGRMFWGEPPRVEIVSDPARTIESAMVEGQLWGQAFRRMQGLFSDSAMMKSNLGAAREAVQRSEEMSPLVRAALLTMLGGVDNVYSQLDAVEEAQEEAKADESGGEDAAASEESSASPLGQWKPLEIVSHNVTEVTADPEPESGEEEGGRRFPDSAFKVHFPQGMIWGVMACAASFGVLLVTERTGGTLTRICIAPIHRWQVLGGKALACFITTLSLLILMILVARILFGLQPDSWFYLLVTMGCVSFAFVGLMMLISVLGRTEQAVGGISWAILLIMAMTGGGMVPRMFMPAWMDKVSYISVVRWSIEPLEGAIWRGYGAADMAVPLLVLIALGAVGFVLGARIFRWTD